MATIKDYLDSDICGTRLAGEDLTTSQYRFVELNADSPSEWVLPSAGGVKAQGVLVSRPDTGEAAKVLTMQGRIVPITCGEPISSGDKLQTDTNGRARVTGAYAGDHILGVALEDGAGANSIIHMLFQYQGV